MLQLPPPLTDRCPFTSVTPWSPNRILGMNCGAAILGGVVGGGGGHVSEQRVRPERSNRTAVQKLTWRNSPWVKGYSHKDSKVSSMTIADVSPTVAIRKVILLYENEQYKEAANFINRLHLSTFKAILEDLPIDMLVDAMPLSLPILEALYAKVFLSDGLNFPMRLLKPESVVIQMAKIFCNKEVLECPPKEQNPVVLSCKKLLKVIVLSQPHVKKQMMSRKRSLERAIEGMGQHGLVGTSDKTLMNLHEALKVEFERAIHQYKTAIQKLDELSLAPKQHVTRSLSYGPAPTKASHQRQLSLQQSEIQERLIKNKSLLNVIEPTLTDHSLNLLLRILRKRVEIDKDILFQFTQLKKEVKDVNPSSVVAQILMKFSKGFSRVLELVKELGTDVDDDTSSSDISGYHSDSDSAIASNNFQSRGGCRRYNLMYSSVRVSNRTPGGSSSAESRSSEGSRSAAHHKHRSSPLKSGNENNRPSSSINIHVPYAVPSSGSTSSNDYWETAALQKEVETLRADLIRAQSAVVCLQEREQKLKDRLSEQAQKMLERGVRFENLSLGERRPTALVRRYGNLYAQARVDTLDALDTIGPLREADDLKSKILFSVVVLAFRSVQTKLSEINQDIRSLLQIPDNSTHKEAANDLENAVASYLKSTSDTYDLSGNIEEVCSQIWATLYDYPCLKNCDGLLNYIKDCVRLAWCLSNQNPPYVIDYESRTFRRDLHIRFHSASGGSNNIKTYLWPALLEGEGGPCVHKGVVLT